MPPIADKACASGFRMALAEGVSLLFVSYVNEIMYYNFDIQHRSLMLQRKDTTDQIHFQVLLLELYNK